jgi:hypothetical protein
VRGSQELIPQLAVVLGSCRWFGMYIDHTQRAEIKETILGLHLPVLWAVKFEFIIIENIRI